MARPSLRGLLRAALAPRAEPARARVDAAPVARPSRLRRARERLDAWVNHTTGLGAYGRDKRLTNRFGTTPLDYQTCLDLWRGEPMAKRIIEIIPNEALREGFEATIANDIDATKALNQKSQSFGLLGKVKDAYKKQRAYGGAALLVGADDGQSPDQPLRRDQIRKIDFMTVLTPRELQAWWWFNDVGQNGFGEVELYRVNTVFSAMGSATAASTIPAGTLVHHSRVIRFEQPVVDRTLLLQNYGWPDSILVPMERELADNDMSWAGAAALLEDFSQGVYKLKGLSEMVDTNDDVGGDSDTSGNDAGTSVIAQRMQMLDYFRSVMRAIVIDKDDDFERKATPLSGYPEMLQQRALRLASVAGLPVSLLMGQSPAGLNATGDADVRWFFNHVEADREHELKPKVVEALELLMLAKNGPTGGQLPAIWGVTFPSLWQLTDLEKSTLRKTNAEADHIYIEDGVLTSDEVAESRFKDAEYTDAITLNADERAKAAATESHAVLEGPQALAMLAVAQAAAAGTIPRDGAVALMATAFAVDEAQAEKILGTPKAPPAPVVAPAPGATDPANSPPTPPIATPPASTPAT